MHYIYICTHTYNALILLLEGCKRKKICSRFNHSSHRMQGEKLKIKAHISCTANHNYVNY